MEQEDINDKLAAIGDMVEFLDKIQCNDAAYFVDGKNYSKKDAVAKAVCEDAMYMADFIPDSNGKITQVHFNKVVL